MLHLHAVCRSQHKLVSSPSHAIAPSKAEAVLLRQACKTPDAMREVRPCDSPSTKTLRLSSSSLSYLDNCCSLADGEALDSGLLLGETESGSVSLLNILGLLVAVELDVAVGAEVGADATVGTVRSTTAGDGALHNNVVDHAVVNVELGSLSVGLQVDEELTNALDGLLWPATLSVLELLGLSVATDATGVAAEGDDLLVLEAVLHVLDGPLQLHALGGAGHFVSVLVMCAQVRDPALSRCKKGEKSEVSDTSQERRKSCCCSGKE